MHSSWSHSVRRHYINNIGTSLAPRRAIIPHKSLILVQRQPFLGVLQLLLLLTPVRRTSARCGLVQLAAASGPRPMVLLQSRHGIRLLVALLQMQLALSLSIPMTLQGQHSMSGLASRTDRAILRRASVSTNRPITARPGN